MPVALNPEFTCSKQTNISVQLRKNSRNVSPVSITFSEKTYRESHLPEMNVGKTMY
jgi:hypothetical protein